MIQYSVQLQPPGGGGGLGHSPGPPGGPEPSRISRMNGGSGGGVGGSLGTFGLGNTPPVSPSQGNLAVQVIMVLHGVQVAVAVQAQQVVHIHHKQAA